MAGRFTLDSREVLATNGLIQGEMVHLFTEMFAGREMEPIPTPAEFAARRDGGEVGAEATNSAGDAVRRGRDRFC